MYPNQPGVPIRPGQPVILRQPPPGSPQFVPRNPIPGPGQRPPVSTTQPGQPIALNPQQRPPFRPATPFPRPPGIPNQRPLFHQRSVPAFGALVRPSIPEDSIYRSQTLDSSEIDHSRSSDDNKNTTNEYVKTPSIAAMNNRSYSLSSNPPEQLTDPKEEARRRSISSVDSYGEGRPASRQGSISGSTENLDKKTDNEIPSRPESRSMSRMNKIIEDEDRSPSSLTDVSQKSPDTSNLSDNVSKSQTTVSKTPDSANVSKPSINLDSPSVNKIQSTTENLKNSKPPTPIENGTKEGTSRNEKTNDSKTQKGKSPNRSG